MANRFWVGGSDAWNGSPDSKWSATSGGTGGASLPTIDDDVFFDANSGTVDISFTATPSPSPICRNLNLSGFTGTFLDSGTTPPDVNGNFTSSSTVTFQNNRTFRVSGTGSFIPNGGTFPNISYNGANMTCSANCTFNNFSNFVSGGSFDANNFNITVANTCTFSPATLTLGSGTWTMGNNVNWSGVTTVNAGSSTIRLNSSNAFAQEFNGGGKSYNKVIFDRGSNTTDNFIISSNTFEELSDLGTSAHTLRFGNGTTQTVANFNVSGTTGNVITIRPTTNSGSNRANFTKTGGGIVSCDYLSIQRSNATPDTGTWYAGANSTNVSDNTGWIFSAPPSQNKGNFLAFM